MEATSHYINAIREKEDNVLYVDTGDIMTGTLAAELKYKNVTGGLMIEFLNKLGCDIWCFGNHEFDLGPNNALGLARLGIQHRGVECGIHRCYVRKIHD
jgi:2',3'-cyclic-nucleotide 2'-phosphodiesterase (5'-nucleotidase family)